ncbi:paraquat-inducible protein A [Geminicoccus roseus]|uniref:paraquat-inducible protein A n=1 Tax=Geminicoccus roseus TaxID=404900 RepID=UPI000425B347|nr:paraquat-inducible protein A [Geminicoccus roseus]
MTMAAAPAGTATRLIACHDCGKLHRLPVGDNLHDYKCTRCRGGLGTLSCDLDPPIALLIAAAVSFLVANTMPFMTLNIEGIAQDSTLLSASFALWQSELWPLGVLVFLVATVAPAIKICGLLYVLLPLRHGRRWPLAGRIYRIVGGVRPWAMMEVYLLGMIVAYVKLVELAHIELGIAVYAFLATVLFEIAAEAKSEPMAVWHRLMPQADPTMLQGTPGSRLLSCHSCRQLVRVDAEAQHVGCPRCGASVHEGNPDAWKTSLALLIAAVVLYVPANVLPVMTVFYFGAGQPDTILSGVIELWHAEMYPVAVLVFTASILVPVLKILALGWLIAAKNRPRAVALTKIRVYRIVELVGRWSMVDVFMIGILTALVHLGNVATIVPGPGALAFASVVVLTMLASSAFDPRSIWRRA